MFPTATKQDTVGYVRVDAETYDVVASSPNRCWTAFVAEKHLDFASRTSTGGPFPLSIGRVGEPFGLSAKVMVVFALPGLGEYRILHDEIAIQHNLSLSPYGRRLKQSPPAALTITEYFAHALVLCGTYHFKVRSANLTR